MKGIVGFLVISNNCASESLYIHVDKEMKRGTND